MKQIFQSLQTGEISVVDLPEPVVTPGSFLIKTNLTLISPGTEKMLLQFGKSGYIEKAKQQPDKLRAVLEKIKTDGVQPTLKSISNKLHEPLPLGYCNVGKVINASDFGPGISAGDRVVSNGYHAGVVRCPFNLCAKIPANVSDEEAVFTVLGAVALQGIRLVQPTLGERIGVFGLGLVGLLTVQLLRANGCNVLGFDFDPTRLELAAQFGADTFDLKGRDLSDVVSVSNAFSRSVGLDAVIIATATDSNDPMHYAANICRKKGRVVLVGTAGLKLIRDDFFKKEITFQVSASYGPGRYDPDYEEKGHDYPVGFVRWTEQRNFEAVLDLIASGSIDVKPLIEKRFSIDEAVEAYKLLMSANGVTGLILKFDHQAKPLEDVSFVKLKNYNDVSGCSETIRRSEGLVGLIGAGSFARSTLLPAFSKAGSSFSFVSSTTGVGGYSAMSRYRFKDNVTDNSKVLSDPDTKVVIIASHHNSHGSIALEALDHGKYVFVEKPLCLKAEELIRIKNHNLSSSNLFVGFNRRFSPLVVKMKALLDLKLEQKCLVYNINAGYIPDNHWVHDPEIGGGRILGEVCHFIDLLLFLTGSRITKWSCNYMNSKTRDTASISLSFSDGSIGSINYFSNGPRSIPKERLEVFCGGSALFLDNFKWLKGYNWKGFSAMRLWRQDKGHEACVKAFLNAVHGGHDSLPIPSVEIFQVAKIAIELSYAD